MGKDKDQTESRPTSGRLTPYQGMKRSFGKFACCDCERPWGSANSWANTAQQCCDCKMKSYPFKQVRRQHTQPHSVYFLNSISNLVFYSVPSATTVPQQFRSGENEFHIWGIELQFDYCCMFSVCQFVFGFCDLRKYVRRWQHEQQQQLAQSHCQQ